jgi:hypothetical protein
MNDRAGDLQLKRRKEDAGKEKLLSFPASSLSLF